MNSSKFQEIYVLKNKFKFFIRTQIIYILVNNILIQFI